MDVIHYLYDDADERNPTELFRQVWKHFDEEWADDVRLKRTSEPPVMEWPPAEDSYTPEFDLTLYFDNDLIAVTVIAVSDYFDYRPGAPEDVAGVGITVSEAERQVEEPGKMVEPLLSIVRETYAALDEPPDYVYGLDPSHTAHVHERFGPPVEAEDLAAGQVQDVSWLMLFPPDMVETYGRQFLLDAPVWRAEELEDGAVLLVAFANPLGRPFDDYRDLYDYFDIEFPL